MGDEKSTDRAGENKRCSACGEVKPAATGFYIYASTGKPRSQCKKCLTRLAIERQKGQRAAAG